MAMSMVPPIPDLFIDLSQRFGLILAGGFAIMSFSPMDKMGSYRNRSLKVTALLIVLFGLFGILGTYTGNYVFRSYANLRAMGVIAAGLFGGPAVGIGAGLLAGGHRYLIDIGGFSAFPCGLATLLEGVAAGLLARRLPTQSLDWRLAMMLGLVGETLHMGLVLAFSRPFAEAVALVELIGLPMIVVNSLGAALFVQALSLKIRLRDLRESSQARQVLSIANQTVGYLRGGLNRKSAQATAEIIYANTQVAAVALTGGETILAHVGKGADHHLPGHPVRTEATLRATRDGVPLFLGELDDVGCAEPGCPLVSAAIVPLRKGAQILGTLKLYGTKDRPLDHTRFELAKGLADLFSTQLELEDIGIKNQLLAHAEIRRLQAQINPHFLFNSLNTIASFCRTSPDQARELLLDLTRYMRRNLDSSRGLIPLEEEMEQVRSYLAIEQARFGSRVRAEIDLENGVGGWLIPPLIVQPLVENGVKHGLLTRESGGVVRLTARREDGHLCVVVEDDGAGMDAATVQGILSADVVGSMSEGIGARNCHRRLQQLYGPHYGLVVDSALDRGTRLSFRIPPMGTP
ncbi:MAG: LytS/YhcK type 5TM receptor domain-containing protein [Desulfovibrionaceae bacterium]